MSKLAWLPRRRWRRGLCGRWMQRRTWGLLALRAHNLTPTTHRQETVRGYPVSQRRCFSGLAASSGLRELPRMGKLDASAAKSPAHSVWLTYSNCFSLGGQAIGYVVPSFSGSALADLPRFARLKKPKNPQLPPPDPPIPGGNPAESRCVAQSQEQMIGRGT